MVFILHFGGGGGGGGGGVGGGGGGGGIELTDWMNLLCWYIFIINAMRSCNERTTLHCVESYLYYIILVNKKIFSEEWNEGEKK